ncbi:MAG: hypothetical protein GF308_12040 [Candidatus Heimdallarchaeota archaeon]|nr:hypothetical protein [Candidatus Heimdallarchaeota archaeon]
MLPNINSLEFSKIYPLSENSVERVFFRPGVNKFLAENGSGKTTLTDLIEHSLVRDAHAFAWNIFSKKRVDKTAYVRAEWVFNDKKTLITHEFTDAGARTRVTAPSFSNKAHTREMYSNFLYERSNLSLEEMQQLFLGIYYKRENDLNLLGTPSEEDLMEFFELLNKAVRMETPETIKLRNEIGEIKRQIDIRRNSKKRIEATLEKMELIFAGGETSAEALDTIGDRKDELERNTTRLRNEMEALRTSMQKLEEEDQKILEKLDYEQEALRNIRVSSDRLKSQKYSLEAQLKQLEKELAGFQKIRNVNYSEIKEKWEQKQNCELCGSSIHDHWSERLEDGCPVCGTAWNQLPPSVKEAVGTDQLKLTTEARDIQQEIEKVSHELRATEEDLENKHKEEEQVLQTLSTLRENLSINNSRRRKIQAQNDEINQKIQRIGRELGSLSAQEKMVNQDENVSLLRVNLEKVNRELEEYKVKLEQLEHQLPEHQELQEILNNFTKSTKEIFGYSMLADTDARTITISKDGSIRDFAAMSWSERYFIDVVFRIAIFHFLLKRKVVNKGLIILDSPEAALDPHRLSLLAKLVNDYQDKINFVVATRVRKFYDLLDGHPLEIKKQTQTSLFDFIN